MLISANGDRDVHYLFRRGRRRFLDIPSEALRSYVCCRFIPYRPAICERTCMCLEHGAERVRRVDVLAAADCGCFLTERPVLMMAVVPGAVMRAAETEAQAKARLRVIVAVIPVVMPRIRRVVTATLVVRAIVG